MIGLSNFFLLNLFFSSDADSESHAIGLQKKESPLESLLVLPLEGLHSLSGKCLRCDQFFLYSVHLWCAFLIGNLLICFGAKKKKKKCIREGNQKFEIQRRIKLHKHGYLDEHSTLFHAACIICAMSSVVNISCLLDCCQRTII